MTWEVEFFTTENGRCPVQEFLDDLNKKKDLPYIHLAIDKLREHGYKLGRPAAAPLRDKIMELRIKTVNGQFRILYFFFAKNTIVLTNGLKKKDDEVTPAAIDKAVEYRNIYFRRKGMKP